MAQEFNFKPVVPEAPAPSFNFKPVDPSPPKQDTSEPSTVKGNIEYAADQAVRTYNQFGEIAQGVNSGIVSIPQGIIEVGAIGVDYAFGTNTLKSVGDGFKFLRQKMGFTPETKAGEVAETVTNFAGLAIPIASWLNRASTVAKGTSKGLKVSEIPNFIPGTSRMARSAETFGASKVGQSLLKSRKRQAVTTTMAMGMSDFFAAKDGTKTVSDAFDALPDALETEVDQDLYGREEAARQFRNKARHFVEGASLNAVFEAAFPIIGGTSRVLLGNPLTSWAASTVSDGFSALTRSLEQNLPERFVENFKRYFLFSGNTPTALKEKITDAESIESGLTDAAANNFKMFDSELKKVFKGQRLFGKGRDGIRKGYADLMRFLEGDPDALDPKEYSPMVVKAAEKMRSQIDGLSDVIARQIEDAPNIPAQQKEELLQELQNNMGKYVRRVYGDALDPEKALTPGTKENAVYRSAVQEVANAMRGREAEEVAEGVVTKARSMDELLEEAERVVKQKVYGSYVDSGLDPIKAAQEFKRNNAIGKNQVGEQPLFRVTENLLKDRLDYYEDSASLRKLRGVKENPKEVYLQTIGDMSRFAASNDLYSELSVSYMKTFDEAKAAINEGRGGPLIVSSEGLTSSNIYELEQVLGYKKLGEFNPNSSFGGAYGALSGSYVKPGVQDALNVPGKIFGDGVAGNTYAALLQAKGISQMSKTVLNPLAIMRNGLSGIFFLGANGNTARNMNLWDSMRLTMGKVNDLSEEDFRVFYDKIGKLGIRDQNLVVNEFQRLLREGSKGPSYVGADAGAQKYINSIPGMRMFQDIYSGTDTFWKIAGFLGENGKYVSAFQKAGINPEQVPAALQEALLRSGVAQRAKPLQSELEDLSFMDVFASDIVKATMPTYSRIPKVVKGIQRLPIMGNFVAFPAEIIRNSANIVRQGTNEMAFKATPELVQELGEQAAKNSGRPITPETVKELGEKAAKRLEQEIRAIGAKRITGYVATTYVVPKQVQQASQALTGATEEELEALDRVTAPFMKGHTLFYIEKPKNGQAQYLDFSYMNPYDFAANPARQALRVYNEKGEITESEVSKITSSLLAGLGAFFEPFASEALIAERVADVVTRNGRTNLGGIVYRADSDNGFDIFQKSLTHILGGFNPGIVEQMYTTSGGVIKPGRFKRALEGLPSGQGVVSDTQEEVLTLMTGFRRIDLDLPNQIKFLGYEYGRARSSANSAFRNVVNANDSTAEDVLNAYDRENENLKRIQAQFYQVISAARTLGMSDEDIYEYIKSESKLGNREISAIMEDTFNPIVPTSSMADVPFYESEIKEQPRVLKELPMDQLFDRYENFLDQKLTIEPKKEFNGFAPDPDLEPTPSQQESFSFKPIQPQSAAPTPSQQESFSFKPIQAAPVAAPSQPRNEVSPILVPNPVTRATVGSQ